MAQVAEGQAQHQEKKRQHAKAGEIESQPFQGVAESSDSKGTYSVQAVAQEIQSDPDFYDVPVKVFLIVLCDPKIFVRGQNRHQPDDRAVQPIRRLEKKRD